MVKVSEILGRVYHENRRGLFLLALSITRCRADAEDAVHVAFTRMCKPGATLGRDPAAYAFTAVRNAAVDQLRRRKKSAAPESSMAACLSDSAAAAADGERDRAIAQVVDELPEELRTVVMLRVFGGLTFRQVGEIAGVPMPTAVSRFTAALERLKPQLKKWC